MFVFCVYAHISLQKVLQIGMELDAGKRIERFPWQPAEYPKAFIVIFLTRYQLP